jgi:hypothetical protein
VNIGLFQFNMALQVVQVRLLCMGIFGSLRINNFLNQSSDRKERKQKGQDRSRIDEKEESFAIDVSNPLVSFPMQCPTSVMFSICRRHWVRAFSSSDCRNEISFFWSCKNFLTLCSCFSSSLSLRCNCADGPLLNKQHHQPEDKTKAGLVRMHGKKVQ